jgi:hypothetical protein
MLYLVLAGGLVLGISTTCWPCEQGGGGNTGGGYAGQGGKSGQRGRSSRGGSSGQAGSVQASAAAIAQYKALKQAGYYKDAKTGGWYYQPDMSKAAVRVAAPMQLAGTRGKN